MISIVMAYNNRVRQIINTFKSYMFYYKDQLDKFEVVLIEDTPGDLKISTILKEEFPDINLNYLFVNRKYKEFRNPGVLYNKAVKRANGENIILTNPENLHRGNVLSVVEKELEEGKYLVFGCKSAFQPPSFEAVEKDENRYIQQNDPFAPWGWYQHSQHNNRLLHFLSAIKKSDYLKIGGFDPAYDKGISLDDNDFVCKILSSNFDIKTFDEPYCLHQAHSRQPYSYVEKEYNINLETFKTKWGGLPHEVLEKLLSKADNK